ncbi:MAG TPA: M20 family metallopeptidase [Thermoanaerobaculia bacterium]|nr:M20 family metallopeptidase [Thermoanaerobaculia bacterium]
MELDPERSWPGVAADLDLPRAVRESFTPVLIERLLALRRQLHRFPELSLEEEQTARALEAELALLRPAELGRVAGTGVIARIAGRDASAPWVAIRGDIDALPIEEATGLPYASEHPGVMHACGHDVHATWAVGAAALLAADPPAGDVWVVLQPAEELALGAKAVLASGRLEGVQAIFGGHVDRRFEVGQVVVQEGPLAASVDSFELELVGEGAHAARPHEARDPLLGAAQLVLALESVAPRRVAPGHPAVLTVASLQAGSADNVIPGRALLRGTLRATDAATRALLREELGHLTEHVAAAHRLRWELRFTVETPPLRNEGVAVGWTRAAAEALLGAAAVVPLGLVNMGGEDFAFYLEQLPGCFFRVGARERGGPVVAAHSPRFHAADEAILVGAALLAGAARVASNGLSAKR